MAKPNTLSYSIYKIHEKTETRKKKKKKTKRRKRFFFDTHWISVHTFLKISNQNQSQNIYKLKTLYGEGKKANRNIQN